MNLETKITIYKFTPQVFYIAPFLHGDVNRDVNRKMTHECFNFSSLLQIQNTF